jgi:AAA15 family ATPase/GTPase
MEFQRIKIEHFRGIQTLEVNELKRINLFVGKNNSGKSALLEAVFLLSGLYPRNIFKIDSFRDIFGIWDDITKDVLGLGRASHYLRMIYFGLDDSQPVGLAADFKDNTSRKLEIYPHYITTQNQHTTESEEKLLSGYRYKTTLCDTKGTEKMYEASTWLDGGREYEDIDKKYKESRFANFLNPENLRQTAHGRLLSEVLVNKQKEVLLKTLQQIDIKIQDIALDANGVIFCDTGLKRLIPLSVMGDGIKRILNITLRMMRMPKGSTLLVDEVENGFHVAALPALWKTIFELAKALDIQVFATTHSHECVNAFHSSMEMHKDAACLYRLENTEGVHRSVAFSTEEMRVFLSNQWEYR